MAARRTRSLGGRWRNVPLVVIALLVLMPVAAGALESFGDRIIEIPLVALALGWIALGYSIWTRAEASP